MVDGSFSLDCVHIRRQPMVDMRAQQEKKIDKKLILEFMLLR